jgi:hypothetical protein
MCTGPDHARLSLASAVCQTVCAYAYCFCVCACMYVCVRVNYSVICGAAPVPVSMHTGWSCVFLSSLSLSLCV